MGVVEVPTVFRGFDDYWSPFLGGPARAPGYVMSLGRERRAALRERIRAGLPTNQEGKYHLAAQKGLPGRKGQGDPRSVGRQPGRQQTILSEPSSANHARAPTPENAPFTYLSE